MKISLTSYGIRPYKFEIDGKRVTKKEFDLKNKLTIEFRFDSYSYQINGETIFVTDIFLDEPINLK